MSLKVAATAFFGEDKLLTTPFSPAHPTSGVVITQRCKPPPPPPRVVDGTLVTQEEEVLAELLLLATVDALVVGSSRFSSLAVFWCDTCKGIWFYQDCSRPNCEAINAEKNRTVFATGLHTDGHQIQVGNHAIIEKLRQDNTYIPTFF